MNYISKEIAVGNTQTHIHIFNAENENGNVIALFHGYFEDGKIFYSN